MGKIELGKAGERFAEDYLVELGHSILERNYKTKVGEIDIISRFGSEIHFVEVKTRNGRYFGYPSESVTKDKLRHIRNVAEIYIQRYGRNHDSSNTSFVIDVMEIMINYIEGV